MSDTFAARHAGTPRANLSRYVTYLLGCLVFSAGATLFIHSELGVDPLDVLSLGLLEHLPITVGIAQASVAVVCIAIWALWNRRRPVLAPFVTFFLCGSLIDLLRLLDLSALPGVVSLALGVLLCAYGSSLIIMSGTGIRAMDLIVISMTQRWRWPFWAAKVSVEAVLLTAGWLLGGPVGIGTLAFLLFVDGLIQPFMAANGKVLHIPNRGIEAPAARVPATTGVAA
ncbi:Integral membrane protein [Actinokineospora spheciospongiae]|uniref:Integral membrane protein n=1 Tax=Actinokineospora spheciospongiae TaxID=909613 RepID=W7JAB5_9PSEU|nr:membrane protein [Actinokineospora spheciospongiae]EWC62984.1 Integral membrane protein [Actinokineospora spheciospongiae]PWW60445.1 putative membrane protein YczE [Actinokineospora spheciospongiae]